MFISNELFDEEPKEEKPNNIPKIIVIVLVIIGFILFLKYK